MEIFVKTSTADRITLEKLFSEYGKVEKVKILSDQGIAFVTMPNDVAAQKAITALNGTTVKGKEMMVSKAKPKAGQPHSLNTTPAIVTVGSNQSNAIFVNPYNFIPVKKVAKSDETLRLFHSSHSHWQEQFRDKTHSGRVVCELETESEMFIGAGKKKDTAPAELEPYTLNGKPAIPPSSLKGMLSSLMEAASNSALRVLENKKDSYYLRRVEIWPPDPLTKIGIMRISNGAFEIEPLNGEYIYLNAYHYNNGTSQFDVTGTLSTMPLEDYSVAPIFYYAKRNDFLPKSNKFSYRSLKPNTDSLIDEASYNSSSTKSEYVKGIIKHFGVSGRDTTIPHGKKHEFFIVYNGSSSVSNIPVPEATINDFNLLAKEAFQRDDNFPFTPFGRHSSKNEPVKLREGDILFYRTKSVGSGQVVDKLSFSAIWRDFCGNDKTNNNPYGYFRTIDQNGFLLPPSLTNQKVSSPEDLKLTAVSSLMGFVEEEKHPKQPTAFALAGRIFLSPGILSPGQDLAKVRNPEKKPLKILDGPKPPCPEFYFTEKNHPTHFTVKKELKPDSCFMPNGRKFYWHHHKATDPYAPLDTNYVSEHETQISKIEPISEKQKFLFTVDFFNLTDFELGMLLYAIKPAATFRHLIGMGKPIGLGRVKIDILNLLFVNRTTRYKIDNLFDGHFFHTHTDANEKRLNEIKVEWCALDNRADFEKQRFCAEAENKKKAEHTIADYITIFRDKVEVLYGPGWLTPLENIGNPASTAGLDVRYPPDPNKPEGYEEAFKWWVQNADRKKGKKEVLKSIPTTAGQRAPQLPVNPRI